MNAPNLAQNVVVETLASGTVLVAEPWGPAPVAAIQLWLPVGAWVEQPELHGAAHLLEHLVFRGAGALSGPELTGAMESLGGDVNAWTSVEQTSFHVTLPAEHAVAGLKALWSLVFAPWLREEDLTAERPIVVEEIRGCADDPGQVIAEALRERVWGSHPYGRSVLGTVESVEGIEHARLVDFHKGHYRPEHAVVVVAGPVDLSAVRGALAELAMPVLVPSLPPRVLPKGEPAQPGLHVVAGGFRDQRLELAFPVGGPEDESIAALDLLAVSLGVGTAALLGRRLRQELDLIHGCTATIEMELQGGLFVLSMGLRPGTAEKVVAAVGQILAEVWDGGLGSDDLRRARALVRSDRLHERETVDGRAHRLGWYQLHHGGPGAEAEYVAQLDQVTVAELARVARRWLRPERGVLLVLAPEDAVDEVALKAVWDAVPGPQPVQVVPRRGVALHRADNGLRMLVENCPHDELVGISVMGRGGSLAAAADLCGGAMGWSEVVDRGAGRRDAVEFAAAVEACSGTVAAWSARNSMGVQAAFPRELLDRGLELVADVLRAPRFDSEELERARQDLLDGRELLDDDPEAVAWERAWSRLFPRHPWGRPEGGTRGSIARLSVGRLQAIHRRAICGQNLCVAVVGDVDPREVEARIRSGLGGLRAGAPVPLQPPTTPPRPGRSWSTVEREDAPAQVVLGWRALGRESPDWSAALVLDAVLGGSTGAGGRLFQSVREERGLAYDVGTSLDGGLGGGAFFCTAAVDPERAADAVAVMRAEVQRIVQEPVSEEELDRVRQGLVAGAATSAQRALARADQLAAGELYLGDGPGWRARLREPLAVTAAQVQALAQRLLADDAGIEVCVGPAGAW